VPLGPLELMARLDAVLRRSNGHAQDESVEVGPLTIDVARRLVQADGCALRLSPFEFKLLLALADQPGRVLEHDRLIEQVWGSKYIATVDSLRAVVRRLRVRLGELTPGGEQLVASAQGYGYYLEMREGPSDGDAG
jgi:DNA-binding response OmpR family regulator